MNVPQIPQNRPEARVISKSNSAVFDTVESKMQCTVYHCNKWIQGSNARNATFHSLKFTKEKDDYYKEPYETELFRIARIIETKVKGEYRNNPIKNICVYLNENKGRTIPGKDNYLIFKVQINGYKITLSEVFIQDEHFIEIIEKVVNQIQQSLNEASFH